MVKNIAKSKRTKDERRNLELLFEAWTSSSNALYQASQMWAAITVALIVAELLIFSTLSSLTSLNSVLAIIAGALTLAAAWRSIKNYVEHYSKLLEADIIGLRLNLKYSDKKARQYLERYQSEDYFKLKNKEVRKKTDYLRVVVGLPLERKEKIVDKSENMG
jgi:hypothetical protein